jgi:hypothetical protein
LSAFAEHVYFSLFMGVIIIIPFYFTAIAIAKLHTIPIAITSGILKARQCY